MNRNIEKMADIARERGVKSRPHVKTHRIPAIAGRLLESGAAGIIVAKVSEAEVMADGDIRDIFIAYPLVTESKIRRAIRLSREGMRPILVHIVTSIGSMVFYLRERRGEFSMFLHAVFSTVAILILIAALYYQFNSLPEYPIRLGNWFTLALLLARFMALALATAKRPHAIEATRDTFIEDERPNE